MSGLDRLFESVGNISRSKNTAAGDYYCAGNDLSDFLNCAETGRDMSRIADEGEKVPYRYLSPSLIAQLIRFLTVLCVRISCMKNL